MACESIIRCPIWLKVGFKRSRGVSRHMYPSCGEQIENNFSPCTLNFCVRLFTYLREIYVTELNAIILSLSLNCAIFSLSKFIQIKLSVNYLFNHAHEVALLAMVDGLFYTLKKSHATSLAQQSSLVVLSQRN